MKLEVFFSPKEVENEYELRDRTVVVVDVLRASSSIVTAIHHGARQVIPVAAVADAMRLAKDLFDDSTILCGERGSKLIDGFDIDNSPANYRPERVKDKSLLYTSTNGSIAVLTAKFARDVVIGAFVNVSAVVRSVASSQDVAVLCAGNGNHFALEDALCAGMIISQLANADPQASLSDGARAAQIVYDRCSDSIMAAVRGSQHGRTLDAYGFGADVTFCATVDVYAEVPYFDGTVIRATRAKRGPVRV